MSNISLERAEALKRRLSHCSPLCSSQALDLVFTTLEPMCAVCNRSQTTPQYLDMPSLLLLSSFFNLFGRRIEHFCPVVSLAGISDDFIRFVPYSRSMTRSHLFNKTFAPNSIAMLRIHTIGKTRHRAR
jgi:hypothetical protein